MGWSAFAGKMARFGKDVDLVRIDQDDATLAPFREAAARVRLETGAVAPRLDSGAVDGSDSAVMLKRALGTICYYGEWTPETLRELAAGADWSFEVPAELLSTKKSVQALVEVCVSNGYGLGF